MFVFLCAFFLTVWSVCVHICNITFPLLFDTSAYIYIYTYINKDVV